MALTRQFAVAILWAGGLWAQTAVLPGQPLGADDLIALSVYGSPELTRTFRVSSDGTLTLPLLSQAVAARGVYPPELERTIAEALRRERILVNPVVSVTVVEYASRPITVIGAVRRPLTFQSTATMTLLEALSRAEGLSAEAGPEIVLTRVVGKGTSEEREEQIRIPARGLLVDAVPELNYRLSGGEQIRVPEAGRIWVVGNVKRPGAFVLRDPADATVLKLLAQAEGIAQFTQAEAVIYRRDRRSGARTETVVPLKKIFDRKQDDQPLMTDDVLYVPEAKGRRLTAQVIDRLLNLGGSVIPYLLLKN